ncbi:hypothetical protein NUW58_g919 [Xylaria curta]|uniref:Uncharacterized protein n=1 Tax=Xylaria curta TaxID=42375 RepID=A0ACC1PQS2_9PEZI|nr:hypothetical protein NUW58_g919 [Xylaria curta]
MEKFNFGRACVLILENMQKKEMDLLETWTEELPLAISDEIREAQVIYRIMGLRSPAAVQQCLSKKVWERCFGDEPLPWIEDPTINKPTFGLGEEMKIALMREAMRTAAIGNIRVALTMLATNSMDSNTNGSREGPTTNGNGAAM